MLKKLLATFAVLTFVGLLSADAVSAVSTTKWVIARDSRVNGKVRCTLKVRYNPVDPNSAVAHIAWKTQVEGGWHVLNWGDGNTYGTIKKAGAERHFHSFFNYGNYPVSFTTDSVDGNETTCSVNLNFNFVPAL